MSENSFDFLLNTIKFQIQRVDTHIRSAIPASTKLQTVLYFLATGCSLRTLQHCSVGLGSRQFRVLIRRLHYGKEIYFIKIIFVNIHTYIF